ncbi:MAG: NAD-dependent epimerase/dehydratase family protein [Bacteroidia bacterium]
MTIGITGANGFIGSELLAHFSTQGHELIAFVRPGVALSIDASIVQYQLGAEDDDVAAALQRCDVLIHTAYANAANQPDASRLNRDGLTFILKHLKPTGRLVFLSTMSAHEDAISEYGQSKLELEALLKETSHVVLKLGLVLGEGGLFFTIKEAIEKLPFIPLVGNGAQPIHLLPMADLITAIDSIISNAHIKGTFLLGKPSSQNLKSVYTLIGEKLGKKPRFIGVPYWMMYTALWVLEKLPGKRGITTENLKGLKALKAFDGDPLFFSFDI